MNGAVSHPGIRKELRGSYKMEGFYRQRGTGKRVITTSFFGGWKGSIEGITTLLLTRKFQIDWFKITFLGEAETAIR